HARLRLDGTGQRVLHDRNLAERIERRDGGREDRGEKPEVTDADADDAHGAVEQLAVEAKPLLVVEAGAHNDGERNPHRPEGGDDAEDDLQPANILEVHPAAPLLHADAWV